MKWGGVYGSGSKQGSWQGLGGGRGRRRQPAGADTQRVGFQHVLNESLLATPVFRRDIC